MRFGDVAPAAPVPSENSERPRPVTLSIRSFEQHVDTGADEFGQRNTTFGGQTLERPRLLFGELDLRPDHAIMLSPHRQVLRYRSERRRAASRHR